MAGKMSVLLLLLAVSLLFNVFNDGEAAQAKESIIFGIEYVNPDLTRHVSYPKLAKIFSNIGIRATKVQSVDWGMVEPKPPKGRIHKYHWKQIDDLIMIFQNNGYDKIHIVLQSISPWGVKPWKAKRKKSISMPPKPEHWDDYAHFVKAIVERYDKDGTDDCPGLKYPILNYEIETEAQGTHKWKSDSKKYISLLKTAYKAAKEANPSVKIILSGFWLGDLVRTNGDMRGRITEANRKDTRYNWHKIIRFNEEALKDKAYFDVVEYHDLGDYKETYQNIAWIKDQMKTNGYEKPLWAGDALGTPTLLFGPVTPHPTPFKLTPREILMVLRNKKHVKHNEINAWYRAEQSRLTFKKAVIAIENGLRQINFGFFMDDPRVHGPGARLLTRLAPAAINWLLAGYLDSTYQPYPAFFTYKLIIEKLRYAKFVARLDLGPGIYAYEFLVKNKPLFAFWSERERNLSFSLSPGKAKITRIITEWNRKSPIMEIKKVSEDGKILLKLTPNPFFLESVPRIE